MARMARVGALLLLACLAGSAAALSAAKPAEQVLELTVAPGVVAAEARALFAEWLAKFKRAYREGDEEFERRLAIFRSNAAFVREYNAQHKSHQVSLNAFADLTQEEFATHRLGYVPDPALRASRAASSPPPVVDADVALPASVDWRAAGGVTAVKDQGQCGSCWAFSTTGSLEGANFVVNGKLLSLSEQELIDCDNAGNDRGCNGGLMDYAYEWIISNGGIDTESDYPYTGADGACNVTKEHTPTVEVSSFQDIPPNNEPAIKAVVARQPVSIAIAASGLQFQLYSHGVFDGVCSTRLDHGVLVVGYGTDADSGLDYWLVKNSWGAVWGESGYIRMAMNKSEAGLCGLAMVPSYPVVAKAGPPAPPGPAPGPVPPPAPAPPAGVVCDATTTCPAGATCCCAMKIPFINLCVSWGCCPYEKATCCTDGASCCPSEHPVCDLAAKMCTDGTTAVAMGAKFAATKALPSSQMLLKRGGRSAEEEEARVQAA